MKRIFLFFIIITLINGCSPGRRMNKETRFIMDTYVTIKVPGSREKEKAIKLAMDRMEEIDLKLNAVNPRSPVFEFNRKGNEINDAETASLVKQAAKISRLSGGAFDITVYPLINAWGFYTKKPWVPEEKGIKEELKRVDYRKITVRGEKVIKTDRRAEIDLGGIAKGFAIKEAVRVLKEQGIDSALVDAGGDIYAMGKYAGRPWKIGIKKPRGEGILGAIDVSDLAVVTSGDYERYFMDHGRRYHHIIDPKTGYPARGLISVTVIAKDPVAADAWSTAIFVAGAEKGMKLAEQIPGIKVLAITEKNMPLYTKNLIRDIEVKQGTGDRKNR